MFRRVEPDGRAVWYFDQHSVYCLLFLVVLGVLLWEVLIPANNLDRTTRIHYSVFERRIAAIIRQAEGKNATPRGNLSRQQCNASADYIYKYKDNISNLVTHAKSLDDLARHHGDMDDGTWRPRDCVARHRLAVVIPYRNRESHLVSLLSVLIPLLKAQELHFRIYVSEQAGQLTFNKDVLMNAAFLEAVRDQSLDCIAFHDVDLLPENLRVQYSCPKRPRHVSASIDEFGYKLPYSGLVGGVLILPIRDFLAVNGYSNNFWGWGAEDDDMEMRMQKTGLRYERPPYNIARFHQITHKKREPETTRYKTMIFSQLRMHEDGVNSVQYDLVNRTNRLIFTHLLIDVGTPPES